MEETINREPVTSGRAAASADLAATPRLHWKLVALITALAAAVAWILASTQPARYRASAVAAIGPVTEGLAPNELLRGVEVLERRTVVATVAALASTQTSRARVSATADDFVEAVILPNTNLVRVDVEGPDAARAAAIANRTPAVLGAQTRRMFKYYDVTMVSPAVTPSSPYFPRTGRAVTAGLLLGLFAGLLAAYALARRRAVPAA